MRHIKHCSMTPSELGWCDKGTIAYFTIEWGKAGIVQKDIAARASDRGAKVTSKSLLAINPKTGESEYIVIATITQKGRNKKPLGRQRGEVKPCSIEGCNDTATSKGFCQLHYGRDYTSRSQNK